MSGGRTMEGRNFIGGSWTAVRATRPRENPANPRETVAVYPVFGKSEARQAFDAAAAAFPVWKRTRIIQRARILQRATRTLEGRLSEVARDLACEVGKPIGEATAEVAAGGGSARSLCRLCLADPGPRGRIWTGSHRAAQPAGCAWRGRADHPLEFSHRDP